MSHSPIRPCTRCGVVGARRSTSVLCADCRYTMSASERAQWTGSAKAVESDHGKVAA